MKRQMTLLLLLVSVLMLSLGMVALAQSGGGYDLTWNSVDGGGCPSTGGGYTLTGGGYTLGGGFWKGGATVANVYQVYLPCVLRNYP